jgi:hypothetical protein
VTGACFSASAIAARAECHRDTVCEALKALEWAGVLTWQNRITRAPVRQRDLFGRWTNRWTVIRTSNSYVFRDPKAAVSGGFVAKSENPVGTQNQEVIDSSLAPAGNPNSPLECALRQLGAGIKARLLNNKGSGPVPAI